MAFVTVPRAFSLAWRLRRPIVLSQLGFNILLTAFIAPLMAMTTRFAVELSGQPALSDFDIAVFLFSPVGFAVFLVITGMFVTLFVLNTAFMMAIALRDHLSEQTGVQKALAGVIPRIPAILNFGIRLAVRVILLILPFCLAIGGLYLRYLTDHDINYYLTFHPPEFLWVAGASAVLLLFCVIVLLRKTLDWALSLPLVIFALTDPKHAFKDSARGMQGRRLSLLWKIAQWFVLSSVVVFAAFGLVGLCADQMLEMFGSDLTVLVRVLILFAAVWLVLNLVITAISTGALAVLLIDKAGWPTPLAGQPSGVALSRIRMAIALGIVVSAGVAGASIYDFTRMTLPDEVEVIAHRGAAGAKPENTMASVLRAIEDGTDWVEIDVQETADGEVIVIHDSDFMKIAGNPLKVWDATMEDVAEIDIGSWFDPAYADQRAPLLSDVLLAAKGKSGVLIELKYYGHDEKLEQRVSDIVTETGMDDQVMSMSLKYGAVQKMKAIRPDWSVGLLSSASAGRIWELETDFVAVNQATISPWLVRGMHDANKKLYVWTVNEPLQMSRMLSLGVDGLITDEPAMAREVISQRHELTNAERLVLALANYAGIALDTKEYRDDSP